ncbi:TonB system transport protein ExbD [Sinorhizobium alkalisoli]|uniref:Biopolymer transport protein ExbD n=1 Tax=Sinorhizobium alkalisoli TaxID=1752398 RepID=A0A1E3VE33_9HYPH|nr:TonB system transport protein ExbD [Sinorhizobium alkalisoli]MCA1492791.1 TonB system transport protein ExbD [Ensifer sp. NBAIM29]MCG5477881.1 TonB system transport protein ExbD [Sinorhizobium alkalisoli]ODR91849.1 TonB system transport protein ExbD [Sinorhizobium alkalisoli]QFI66159.1 Biopolymer transport protein ExbD/TolR [Sinorhizobium alkalisoli]
MAGRISEDGGELDENSEINVTPFIDVMLVLLIIFMVAAPLATVDVKVDLPQSAAKPTPHDDKPVFVTLKSDLTLAVGNEEAARETFSSVLDRVSGANRERRVLLRADRLVDYGELMAVMNLIQRAGYSRIALVGLEAAPAP